MLPSYAAVDNPLDMTTIGLAQPEIFGRTAQAMLDDPAIGALILALIPGSAPLQLLRAKMLLPVPSGNSPRASSRSAACGASSPLGTGRAAGGQGPTQRAATTPASPISRTRTATRGPFRRSAITPRPEQHDDPSGLVPGTVA